MGFLKYIFMVIAAIGVYQMLSGDGGVLTYNAKKNVPTDAKDINVALEKVLDSQKEYQKQHRVGDYALSVAGPFTKGLDASGVGYVAELDGFADKIFNKDGTQFDPSTTTAANDKETYVLVKGVKIYTAPIYETVIGANGNNKMKTSFKVFVDASNYSSNSQAVLAIENEICSKLKELAGEFRTGCNGSKAEKITSYANNSNELTLTEKKSQYSDDDGFVSASITGKYKI